MCRECGDGHRKTIFYRASFVKDAFSSGTLEHEQVIKHTFVLCHECVVAWKNNFADLASIRGFFSYERIRRFERCSDDDDTLSDSDSDSDDAFW